VSNEEMKIEALKEGDTYKYLGLEQRKMTEDGIIMERLRKEVQTRLQWVCKTGLNARNVIKAINTYALPVLTYSCPME